MGTKGYGVRRASYPWEQLGDIDLRKFSGRQRNIGFGGKKACVQGIDISVGVSPA